MCTLGENINKTEFIKPPILYRQKPVFIVMPLIKLYNIVCSIYKIDPCSQGLLTRR